MHVNYTAHRLKHPGITYFNLSLINFCLNLTRLFAWSNLGQFCHLFGQKIQYVVCRHNTFKPALLVNNRNTAYALDAHKPYCFEYPFLFLHADHLKGNK